MSWWVCPRANESQTINSFTPCILLSIKAVSNQSHLYLHSLPHSFLLWKWCQRLTALHSLHSIPPLKSNGFKQVADTNLLNSSIPSVWQLAVGRSSKPSNSFILPVCESLSHLSLACKSSTHSFLVWCVSLNQSWCLGELKLTRSSRLVRSDPF